MRRRIGADGTEQCADIAIRAWIELFYTDARPFNDDMQPRHGEAAMTTLNVNNKADENLVM